MSVQEQRKNVSAEPRINRVQIQYGGKTRIVQIYTPAIAIEEIFEVLRPELIDRAYQVVKNRSTAEDIVQGSLLNAYYRLNNGTLYAIKHRQGHLMIRGDGSTRSARRTRQEKQQQANRLLYHQLFGTEAEQQLVSGRAAQEKKLVDMIEQWKKGMPGEGISIIDEPSAWMQKIVLNNALKYYNQEKRRQSFLADSQHWDLAEDSRSPNPEKELIRKEEYAEVRQAVAILPEPYRSVVELRYLDDEDNSFQIIAEKLERPVHTVTSQATRALKILREGLEGQRTVKNGLWGKRKK